ncbi:MAG: hypothetical protein ACI81L_000737 [Verrucomicrobiales bacterium]|jgi:hypothetical protein
MLGERGRVEAMRVILSQLDYPWSDDAVVGTPDPRIIGPPKLHS